MTLDIVIAVTGIIAGIVLGYASLVLLGRRVRSKQKVPKVVYGANPRGGQNSVQNIGETIVAVLNGKETHNVS
ncbi:MAG: hypothetical protein ACXABY_25295 [Candidatus Thorarchaeota archaeon]|jgi:hypothetical protein